MLPRENFEIWVPQISGNAGRSRSRSRKSQTQTKGGAAAASAPPPPLNPPLVKSLVVDKNQQALVEEKTRDQANSRLWFWIRTGRITASKFKAACHTDPTCPSQSLIMGIFHPEMARFNAEATKWGCQHEGTAREACCRYQKNRHADFVVTDSGQFISTKHPYLGASPDGMVTCGCCGAGVCKIKVLLCFSVLQERGGVSCYHGKL